MTPNSSPARTSPVHFGWRLAISGLRPTIVIVALCCSSAGLVSATQPARDHAQTPSAPVPMGALAPRVTTPTRFMQDHDRLRDPARAGSGGDTAHETFRDGEKTFAAVKEMLLKEYVSENIGEDALYRAAVQGMLENADPALHQWNKLLSPSELADLNVDLQGQMIGIGAKIMSFDPNTGYASVAGSIRGSPAERAGLVSGDLIVSVNGTLYKGRTIHDVIHDIRGQAGQTVTLSVLRGDQLLPMSIRREAIVYEAVESAMVSDRTGYIRVPAFSARTASALKTALGQLAASRPESLVLDLRGNPGGSFDAAIACAELLLPNGAPIVRLERRGGTEEVFKSKAKEAVVFGDLPLAVLVDHETSSGAELLTGALKEGRNAQVVGKSTYGKWTVQSLEELPNGYGMKFTTGLFQTPAGHTYEGIGFEPDIRVDMDAGKVDTLPELAHPQERVAADPQLRTALAMLEHAGH